MISKLLICPYFGDLPPWMNSWYANTERMKDHGYDFLFDDDEDSFRDRVRDRLEIEPPPMHGTGNIWDFRPALGFLYEEETRGFDWWGHTDFDCVYGRVERFVTDEVLEGCDIYTDCAHGYIAGPWSLYRNEWAINDLFFQSSDWRSNMQSLDPTGWCETTFTQLAKDALGERLLITNKHAFTEPEMLRVDGERLMHGEREIPYFHFRRTKEYPKGCVK